MNTENTIQGKREHDNLVYACNKNEVSVKT